MRREIADVLETVKRAKDRDKGCTLLIGAGCSVKAGIPGEEARTRAAAFARYGRRFRNNFLHES
jgi:NAD-dependent SIR2 family protein deacetylase